MKEDTQATKTSRAIQKEETRRKIIEVARSLFSSKSIRSVSTQEIANEAGIAKGSIFHHFRNKEELVSAVMINFFSDFKENFDLIVDKLRSNPSDYKNIMTSFLDEVFRHEVDNPNLTKFILDFMAEYTGNKDKEEPYKEMMLLIEDYISKFIEIFNLMEIENAPTRATIFFAMLDGLSLQFDFENGLDSEIIPELVTEVVGIIEYWVKESGGIEGRGIEIEE